MVRAAAVVLVLASSFALAIAGGCGRPGSSSSTAMWIPPEEPPPLASERCYRERFQVRGEQFELRLRLRFEPDAARITQRVSETGANGDAAWTTVMTVDGDRFTAVEQGPEGEARSEGTLAGPPWRWTGWHAVIHQADGFDEHAEAELVDAGLAIRTETRARDGSLASTGRRLYLTTACETLGDEPIETLYPKPPPRR